MKLFERLRPRWQHADARIRRAAVEELTNPAQLRQVVETDSDPQIREAAFARLHDGPALVAVAKGASDCSEKAVARLQEPAHLIDVARHAVNPRARAAAVCRIDDPQVLLSISSLDEDPFVRRCARRHQVRPNDLRARLRDAVAKLRVAETMAGEVAEFCGSLDDVCASIVTDGRFSVHGLPSDPAKGGGEHAGADRTSTAGVGADHSGVLAGSLVELMAGQPASVTGAQGGNQSLYYRIKVWRSAESTFAWNLEERRVALSKDAVAWSQSSNGASSSAPVPFDTAAPIAR